MNAFTGTVFACATAFGICTLAGASAATPAPNPLLRQSAASQALRTTDIRQLETQHMAALGHLQRRAFVRSRRSSEATPAPQTIEFNQRNAAASHNLDYCANHPLDVNRVSGRITPLGTVTVTGSCFGTAGTLHMAGVFRTGTPALPDWAPDGVDFQVTSWTDTAISARMPYVWGVPDKQVELRLRTQRVAARMKVVGPNQVSAPIVVHFTADRTTVGGIADAGSCATGAPADALLPEYCAYPGWSGHNCDLGTCTHGSHVRKSPASGVDTYSVALKNGFVLDQVQILGSNADVVFNPSLDPSHVSWSVRWHTVPAHDPDAVKRGFPQFTEYHDGSYMMYVTITGPTGVFS